MYQLNRSKAVRGQAIVVLLAVSSFTVAGAGLGFCIGKYSDNPIIAAKLPLSLSAPAQPEYASSDATTTADVDAITARVGEMQAELMRLNALGERLVEMAGLDPKEFDFENPPPQGGPEVDPDASVVRDYTIKELADQLSSVVSMVRDRQRKLDSLQDVIVERNLTAKALPSGWPVQTGYITSRYGFRIHPIYHRRIFHSGIDLASRHGTPIHAAADGVVVFSGTKGGYGRVVDIRHIDGIVTRYGHNSANLVREGDLVRKGQDIARVGSSGAATGPHVHFEVRIDDHAVDPSPYLNGAIKPGLTRVASTASE